MDGGTLTPEQIDFWFEKVYPDMFVCKACGAVVPGIEHFPDLHVKFHEELKKEKPWFRF